MTMNLSRHAETERINRLMALEKTLGFTKIVLEVAVEKDEVRYLLTSSGIIIVKNLYRDIVVTAFMANINQCYRLYRLAGKKQMSPKVYKKVTKNCEKHSNLFEIRD